MFSRLILKSCNFVLKNELFDSNRFYITIDFRLLLILGENQFQGIIDFKLLPILGYYRL
jgi:hypothetical protein